jgi:hypothetical protein
MDDTDISLQLRKAVRRQYVVGLKAWPGNRGVCLALAATAILDRVWARRARAEAGRDEETAYGSNKETDQKENPTSGLGLTSN